ncbi:MAG: kinase [Thermoprotei archaeon]|nr:MAG: kinase [Thermoprotei archaeon]
MSSKNSKVNRIIITGTPGVGKTSVSKKVASILNAKYVNLAEFVKSNKLFLEYDNELNSYIIDEEKTRKTLRRLLREYSRVVVDTHILTVFDPNAVDLAIVLRLNPKILLKRLKERNYSLSKIKVNIQAEMLGVCLSEAVEIFGLDKVAEVDTTARNLEEVVREVLNAIDHPNKYRPGKVDWSQLIYDDELMKYLV